ncbi:MAG: hypothetical protein ACREOI_31365, partial [bacterium]
MQIRGKNFERHLLLTLLTTMIVMFSAALSIAQTSTLNRPYAPVVLQGDRFSAFSNNVAPVGQLFLYRYSSANSSWEQIPWQIDEVEPDPLDATRTTFFRTGDGLLDSLDQLSFMAKDAGDKAPDNSWVDNVSTRGFPRYEIELNDPLPSGGRGYIYLYRSTTLTVSPSLADYVTYVPPQGQAGNDVVRTIGYEEGHQDNGIHNSLLVPVNAGGSGTNFLDRLKLRFQIQIFGSNVPITENAFMLLGINFRDGRVRVIRELRERISLGNNIDFPLLILYYGYSNVLGTGLNLTNLPVPVNLLRQSFDFAPNVTGASWYNQNLTTAVTVDGTADNLSAGNLAIVNPPNLNWYMLSSAQGSFVNIFSL